MKSTTETRAITLLEASSAVSAASVQSHVAHSFYVPAGVSRLQLSFSYEPEWLEDRAKGLEMAQAAVSFYQGEEHTEEVALSLLPLRNLATLSLADPNGFRGACHRGGPQQLTISEAFASPGLLKGELPAGMWTLTVSMHAIVTDELAYRVAVTAHGESVQRRDGYVWRNKPLERPFPVYPRTAADLRQNSRERTWMACELHAHTLHSDGRQTLLEMAQHAKELNLACVAVTDHNTTSPLQEKEAVERETGIRILNGLEWTTFFGHMLTLGYRTAEYTDWRAAGPEDIHAGIQEVHRLGALAGIAHPFRIGNPVCTGCYWEFAIEDIAEFDYIEVWNSVFPSGKRSNQQAFQLWTELLNQGYLIPAVSGRDWHGNEESNPLIAVTHVHVPAGTEDFREDLLQAIREGRMTVSLGPVLDLLMHTASHTHTIGDCVNNPDGHALFEIQMTMPEHLHAAIALDSLQIQLVSNLGTLVAGERGSASLHVVHATDSLAWVRAELYGTVDGLHVLAAFTNPIYLVQ
ncbi:CehA/McbA family metallohydrolase [Ectobacillus ponti]|uniref:CehA/McbA family metallohydrolase n=1 Tax=Ectobacillus ponti TaxID=2961894 RepID=A0AA41X8T8_9BACI|nr:CehA/McbA family metallohydrolase [Ectobacillus ponti]MCP8971024.1 CehA/McbA family metallohydrolase [Ectobacillus ponti]